MIFIFSSLAPNSTLFILLDFVSFIIGHWLTIACSYTRDSSEDDDEKTKIHNFVQLSFTKIIKHLFFHNSATDYFITSKFVSSHCNSHNLSLSLPPPPLHLVATIASVEFFWSETKTYPIPSHLDASRHSAKTVPLITKQPNEQREMATWIIDWVGENPRQNENIALEPRFLSLLFCWCFNCFGKGKLRMYPLFSKQS